MNDDPRNYVDPEGTLKGPMEVFVAIGPMAREQGTFSTLLVLQAILKVPKGHGATRLSLNTGLPRAFGGEQEYLDERGFHCCLSLR
jgi:hypothetical protein